MSFGSMLFAIATLMCASPHWILPPQSSNLEKVDFGDYCNRNNGTCKEKETFELETKYHVFVLIFFALLSIGFGQTAIFTLGIPFLDDNVKDRDSAMYFCGFI